MALSSLSAKTVTFRLKGPRFLLESFLKKENIIEVPVRSMYQKKISTYKFNLDKYEHNIPLGIEVLNKNVREVSFSVAKKESKTVPVKLNLSDYLEENFEISEIEMDQNQMRINGSSLQLKEIDTLYTEEISLKEFNNNELIKVKILKPEFLIDIERDWISLKAKLKEKTLEKTLELPIQIKMKDKTLIHSSKAKIKVQGTSSDIKRISPRSIQVWAGDNNLSDFEKRLQLQVNLPPNLKLITVEPEEISIK